MLKHLIRLRKCFIYMPVRYINNNEVPSAPEIDLGYYCDPKNAQDINQNIKDRECGGDVGKVLELSAEISRLKGKLECNKMRELENELIYRASLLPNKTDTNVSNRDTKEPHVLECNGHKKEFNYHPKPFHVLAERMDLFRTSKLGRLSERRSYCLKDDLALLEQALVRHAMSKLISHGFIPMSVPDLLQSYVIEGCGMATKGARTQVYKIHPILAEDICLSGTAEMALAGYFINQQLQACDLPQMLAAVSRCFRAEISNIQEEKGLYRVHQFSKVEMFGVTSDVESGFMLEKFVEIQKNIFSELGLHFKLLDMPSSDLGAPAYRKIDIEAWMPGQGIYGEISSASNCTDYQSRRLHIKYHPVEENIKSRHCHTVNGTACAVPRMLIAIFENFQNEDGSVTIPEVLRKYMNGQQVIQNVEHRKKMQWIK